MKKSSLFILLLATVRLSAQGILNGIVISPYENAEHNVSVELFTNNSDRFDDKIETLVAKTLTDKKGYYQIEGIAPGTYAVRFNNKGDSTCMTITMINVEIAGGDKLLDVRLNPRCTSFGPPLECISKKGSISPSPKITVQLETHPKYKVVTKVEFEIIASGEKSFRYTNDNPIVTQYFPAGTGRVRVRVYEHLGYDLWQLVKTYVAKPRVTR